VGLDEEESLLKKHRMLPLGLAALTAVILTAVGFVASGAAAPQATFKAGLVSDVGRSTTRASISPSWWDEAGGESPEDPVPRDRISCGR